MNIKVKIKTIFFVIVILFSSTCYPQGDINVTINEASMNQALQALADSKAINMARNDGQNGVADYHININTATINLIGNSQYNAELTLNLNASANFNLVLFNFNISEIASVTVYGNIYLTSQDKGYKLLFNPEGVNSFTLTNSFLDEFIQDPVNGIVSRLHDISLGSYTSLLPGVIGKYFQSSTPLLTVTDNAATLSLSLNNMTTAGNLTSNESWYGGVNLTGSVAIPSGISLNIQPGTSIYLPSGASITANGSLIANGNSTAPITFTSNNSSNPGSWGSIFISGSGANGSSLQNVNIQYGTDIEVTNANNIIVQNCAITNSSMHGIKFYGSTGSQVLNSTISNTNTAHGIYIQDGSNVNCTGNTIKKTNQNKSGVGIYFGGGGTGIATQNDISGFSWGIGAIWGSSPTSQHASGVSRNNRITNCYIGIDVYYNSYPVFGIPSATDTYGINSIYNNTTNINVGNSYPTYSSSLYACQNWWGSNPPNTSLFNVNSNSYFYYLGYATSDPWNGIPLPSINQKPVEIANSNSNISEYVKSTNNYDKQAVNIQNINDGDNASIIYDNNTNILDSLIIGINLRDANKKNEAKNFFISFIKEHPSYQAAYPLLYTCADSNNVEELIKNFETLPEEASNEQKLLLAYLYLKDNKIDLSKSVNNKIIADNNNTPLAVRAMLNNYYIALYNENNFDEASTILTKIENQSDLSIPMEISSARDALTTYKNVLVKPNKDIDIQNQINSDEGNTPQTFSLNQNYPNPFNPSTIIEYQLPNNSMVTLKVYDILGREISTLVNGYKGAGKYTISFDGSKLASGIYFYQLRAGNYISIKKMLLIK